MIESLEFFALGIAFGLAGGLSPGPTMTLVIAQTVRHGLREGIKVAIAPLLTDTPIVLLSILVVSRIEAEKLLALIAGTGALFLMYLAYESFKATAPDLARSEIGPGSLRKGFLANFFNPHPWIFWMTVGGPVMQRALESSAGAALLFIVAKYTCLVGAKILIAVIAERSREWLGRAYSVVMKLIAVALFAFALLFLREAAGYLGWLL